MPGAMPAFYNFGIPPNPMMMQYGMPYMNPMMANPMMMKGVPMPTQPMPNMPKINYV